MKDVEVLGGVGDMDSNGDTQFYQQHRVYNKETISPCLNGSAIIPNVVDSVRIRQATKDGAIPCRVGGGWRI